MFLNDKYGYWAANKSVYFSLQRMAGRVIVLGDPIGDVQSYRAALKELQDKCKVNLVKKPIFYQISSKYIEMYKELNYQIIKIGEEAKVSLPTYTLEGKQGAKLRTRRNKFERSGFLFKVFHPPYSKMFLEEIKSVSDAWLGNRNEKGFSVSYFEMEYIARFPIATVINKDGAIIAFATLPSHTYQNENNVHIDLMRYVPESPHGTMDVLFTSIFFWGKEKGYDYCSLGMAPLSNVGTNGKSKSLYEWTARYIFLYGERLYKFKGLKEYKEKFASEWEPRYIAYKRTTIIGVLVRVVILINLKYKKQNKLQLHFIKKAS
jgi:phosphatidylglycerol lysyltransferase